MTSLCASYHVALEYLADGVAVHLVGHLPEMESWIEGYPLEMESCLDGQGILEYLGRSSQTKLYVDCEGLKSLGHPGLSDLIRLRKVASESGGRALLCRVPPDIQEILTLCRFDQFFDYRSEAAPGSKLRWIDASWLSWNAGTVARVAEGIHEMRAFGRLPILADALLDAGCDNEELIAHCRSAGPHVRGCWAIDLILGKS